MRPLLAIACLLLLAAPLAAEKTTVDPNTRPHAEAEAPGTADVRLQQKVSCEASNKMVRHILDELSASTGIQLKCGFNNGDWQVRERRMCIFAKDIPLAQLMNSIARVMKFKWSITDKDGTPTYRLIMDRRALLGADRDTVRKRDELERRQFYKRKQWVDQFLKIKDMTPAELQDLKQTDPHTYQYVAAGAADSIASLIQAAPEVKDRLISGEFYMLSPNQLPPEARQPLLRALEDLRRSFSTWEGKELVFDGDPQAQYENIRVMINGRLNYRKTNFLLNVQRGNHLIGDLGLCFTNYGLPIEMADPESAVGRQTGIECIRSSEEGKSTGEVSRGTPAAFPAVLEADLKKLDFGEPSAEHPDEPGLHEKIKLKVDDGKIARVQEALAKASGLSIVSDSFAHSMGQAKFAGDEQELQAILDRVQSAFHYNWWKRGEVIEFRDRFWFLKRMTQVPEEWLQAWRSTFKKTGTLDLDSLAQIAALSLEQYDANIRHDEVLGQEDLSMLMMCNRDLLRFYSSLTSDQQTIVFTETGIPLAGLTTDQLSLAQQAFKYFPKYRELQDQTSFRAVRTAAGKAFQYGFTGRANDELVGAWGFTTPEYKPPQPKAEDNKPGAPRN